MTFALSQAAARYQRPDRLGGRMQRNHLEALPRFSCNTTCEACDLR
jgi:hypothetical protein